MNRRRGKTIGLSIALLAPALLLASAWTFRDAIIDWWHRIPVTRTWGDLRSQWPIDLGNGIKVRLGIESTRCPQWSGVLVYCLTEGYLGGIPMGEGEPLGPLLVSVSHEGREEGYPSERFFRRESTELEPDSALFARAIPIPRPGRYEVRVSTSDGRLLRRVTVHGTAEPFHPWMPLYRSPKPTELRRGTGAFAGTFVIRGNGIAIPDLDGLQPYPIPGPEESLAGRHLLLPGLLPRSPKPEISLAVDGDQFILTSKHEILVNSFHRRILSRWWVNGEPFFPDPRLTLRSGGREGGMELSSKKLSLELDFDPAQIGARSGDRIGLQLLYLDHGWEYIDPEGRLLEKLWLPRLRHRALLTNRVEFTAP